ncbi:hypothetical protein SprV_0100475700 [Sparganum proliferum]
MSEFGIGVAHRPEATIRRQLMHTNEPIPINQKSGVIYQIDCSCGHANYVGETGKQVRTRLHEHELAVRRKDKLSLVAAHASSSGHGFDFQCVRILGQSDDRVDRLLQEAWQATEDSISRHIDLPIAYQALREQISSAARGHPWQSSSRIRDAREAKLKQKLTTLSEKNPHLCHDKVVHNLSSKQLAAEQIKALSHDACFNTTDAQPLDFIVAAESVIPEAPITEENRNLLRQRISSRLMSHKQSKTLSKAEEALRTLKADKSIVILPAE